MTPTQGELGVDLAPPCSCIHKFHLGEVSSPAAEARVVEIIARVVDLFVPSHGGVRGCRGSAGSPTPVEIFSLALGIQFGCVVPACLATQQFFGICLGIIIELDS